MKKNLTIILFIICIIVLYFTRAHYSDYSLKKSIAACVIAQKKVSKNMTADEAKKYCEEEIKKRLIVK